MKKFWLVMIPLLMGLAGFVGGVQFTIWRTWDGFYYTTSPDDKRCPAGTKPGSSFQTLIDGGIMKGGSSSMITWRCE